MAGIALLFVGNSIFDGTEAGIEESFVSSFTGHLSVRARGEVDFSIFGDQTPVIGELFRMPTLAPYPEIRTALERLPGVESVTPVVSGLALLEYGNYRVPAPLIGVEGDSYLRTFPGIQLMEGRFLQRGERGIVLPRNRITQVEAATGQKITLGTVFQFSVADGITFRIRSAPLVGIIQYPLRNDTLDSIVLVDPTTLRELYNYLVGGNGNGTQGNVPSGMGVRVPGRVSSGSAVDSSSPVHGPEARPSGTPGTDLTAPAQDSASNPFNQAPTFIPRIEGATSTPAGPLPGTAPMTVESIDSLFEEAEPDRQVAAPGIEREAIEKELAQALQAPRPAADEGAWNFLLIRVARSANIAQVQRELNRLVQERGWEVAVLNWRQTAGASAMFLYWMRMIFNIGFLVVAVASLIILIDTLIMSVLERVPEIGTLRALGASPSVIRKLFLTETTLLAAAAGFLGVGVGIAAALYLKAHPFQLENPFLIQLFGGSALLPRVTVSRAILSWLTSIGMGLVGWIYPVRIALRIQPRTAMERSI